jgi:UDP-glucose 4-epimerase
LLINQKQNTISSSKILVTGGLGFIGSHTCVELIQKGFDVLIVDDLSNSTIDVLEGIKKITRMSPEFVQLDLKDKKAVQKLFEHHQDLSAVIHFAAYKAVGESVTKPLEYYQNNLNALVYLLQAIEKKGMEFPFIFSSSCTVYGQADALPITEESPIKKAASPYGNTKQIGEQILQDTAYANPLLKVISLRYFNPIGAHPSNEIGELPLGTPQNLIPFITQTAAGIQEKLLVFGDDYPTPDGTCIRDYIHVSDLAKAHVVALERLHSKGKNDGFEIYNLGTGQGNSVLEVIKTFEKISGQPLNYEITSRREGDIIAAYADTTKANEILGWKTQLDLEAALKTAWEWEKKIRRI